MPLWGTTIDENFSANFQGKTVEKTIEIGTKKIYNDSDYLSS